MCFWIKSLINPFFGSQTKAWIGIAILAYMFIDISAHAEGTKQLEPAGAPSKSYCRIALSEDQSSTARLPFALVNCPEVYRLLITVKDFTVEKINLGFGDVLTYENSIKNDVSFQVRDPYGNIVPGFALQPIPFVAGSDGFIETRAQALAGPNINNTNPSGYKPLIISPLMNGNYVIEFDLPNQGNSRILELFDFTVTNSNVPVAGRLWSKAWQFSSGSNDGVEHQSYAILTIYSNDGIVTSFNTNGLAGGIWGVFSNEIGCSTIGAWNERRKSTQGIASILPQYKIFLTNPDLDLFPTGIAGVLNSFEVHTIECDTIMTFEANVSKTGNIEILVDVPPMNPGSISAEDVQLAYPVNAGSNILSPGWDGLDAFGKPVASNSLVEVRVRFLNGLSNIPLYDVEYNPDGFKIDIVRPIPPSGETKLRLFWDDRNLGNNASSNTSDGCIYDNSAPITGCHEWSSYIIGDKNTLNSWWYYAGEQSAPIPYMFRLSPPTGKISGPTNVCSGQRATFKTRSLPFAHKYIWEITGMGFSKTIDINAPDTTLEFEFYEGLAYGLYSIKVKGYNECGSGPTATYAATLYEFSSPISGPPVVCTQSENYFTITGTFTEFNWSSKNGSTIGLNTSNPVIIKWDTPGADTIRVITKSMDCGTRISKIPVMIQPSASVSFNSSSDTICPNMQVHFIDNSSINSGSIISRQWSWDDGNILPGNNTEVDYTFINEGINNTQLKVTTDKGCETTENLTITVISNPEAAFTVYRNCISDTVQISNTSNGIGLNSWQWDFGTSPLMVENANSPVPIVLYESDGTFPVQLILSNRFGCIDTLQHSITIHQNPTASFTYPLLCEQTEIKFIDNSIVADASFTDYSWLVSHHTFPEAKYSGTSPIIRFLDDDTFEIIHKVTDEFGCSDTVIRNVSVNNRPMTEFSITEVGGANSGELIFINQSVDVEKYFWDFGNEIISSLQSPTIKYENEGDYLISLIGYSNEGCADTAFLLYPYSIPDLLFPNAFTPGTDNLNSTFLPALPRKSLEPYTFQIYNRLGQMLFETHDPFRGWNGEFNNQACPAGVYTWVAKFMKTEKENKKPSIKRGMVTLIR